MAEECWNFNFLTVNDSLCFMLNLHVGLLSTIVLYILVVPCKIAAVVVFIRAVVRALLCLGVLLNVHAVCSK